MTSIFWAFETAGDDVKVGKCRSWPRHLRLRAIGYPLAPIGKSRPLRTLVRLVSIATFLCHMPLRPWSGRAEPSALATQFE